MSEKLTIIADSTAINQFMDCERLYQYRILENLVTDIKIKDAIQMGSLGHKLLEIYYKSIITTMDYKKSVEIMMAFDMESDPDITIDTELKQKVRHRVFESIIYHYSNQSEFMPRSEKHVEVGFSESIYEDDEHFFVLEGRIDLDGTLKGMACIVDHKFQLAQRALYKKTIQFRNYALVTRSPLLVINYIRFKQKFDETTLERVAVPFLPQEHEWWRGELIKIFFRMAQAKKTGLYPQQWNACMGRFNQQCPFTELCEHTDQNLVERIKEARYIKAKEWKPWGKEEGEE